MDWGIKHKSCRWCFNLRRRNEMIFCRVHKWERIMEPLDQFLKNPEFKTKAKECKKFEGEVYPKYIDEKYEETQKIARK